MSGDRPVALVTGAAKRVGRAIAIELARAGFDLIVTFNRSDAQAEETALLATTASGGKATVELHAIDFDDPPRVETFARSLASRPRLDAMVHNASSYSREPLGSITAEAALRHVRINALAPLLLTQALVGPLTASSLPGGGAVICLTDIQSLGRPHRGFAPYAISKAALNQMVDSLAIELAPRVRVIGVAPGVVAWPEGTPANEIEAYEKKIPLGRSGGPEDVATIVRWLILEATYITGEIIRLDGGRWLR